MAVALITGASSGIGYEFARIFARNQYDVVLVARGEKNLQNLKQELEKEYQCRAWVISVDLAKPDAIQHIDQKLKEMNIDIEILVNNAGFGHFGYFAESSWENDANMISVNIAALTGLTKLLLPQMIKNGRGKILNVASTASFQPGPLMAVYYATKAYVLSFSEAIANELQGTGVTVTALCPGPTASGFQAAAQLQHSKLVQGKKMPTSAEVAEEGYQALQRQQSVYISGFQNWLLVQSVRFMPRRLVTKIVRNVQERVPQH